MILVQQIDEDSINALVTNLLEWKFVKLMISESTSSKSNFQISFVYLLR
jgi:hypothetical protein